MDARPEAKKATIATSYETPFRLVLDICAVGLAEEQFFRLCVDNRDLRFELTAQGELIIMPPTGMETGWRNAKITQRLGNWAEVDGRGLVFGSSTGFTLPNGSKRSPDASWVRRERWEALSREERQRFAPICPDFVLELRSPSDALAMLEDKMEEYMANGAQLGLLVDPETRSVYIYRPGQPVERLEDPETVVGDPILPGFTLNVRDIW
jgi:Uma2 family endonuclease